MSIGLPSVFPLDVDPVQTFLAVPVPPLHESEPDIFARFEGVPGHNQDPLSNARILIVGCGGLNTWTAIGLARSGATNLTLVEHDIVEITNLQRQPYTPDDRGKHKAPAFAQHLVEQGHMVAGGVITTITQPFDESFLETYAIPCDLAVIGVDNNDTRLLAARWARQNRIPAVFTAMSLAGSFRCYAFLQGRGKDDACIHCARPDMEPEEVAPCASATVAGCFSASALAVFFCYRALMGWPNGTEPFNYREIDLMGEAPDARGWVARRKDCPTCSL